MTASDAPASDTCACFRDPEMALLAMGIWADDGTVWLPKELFPTRNDARKWAVENCGVNWIDVRTRSVWMAYDPEHGGEETPYVRVIGPDLVPDAFKCWEI